MRSEIRNPKSEKGGDWRWIKSVLVAVAVVFAVRPASVFACAACYGASDSPMAKGMNWGIFSLLVVVVGMLGGIASFFVYLARRSASFTAAANAQPVIKN